MLVVLEFWEDTALKVSECLTVCFLLFRVEQRPAEATAATHTATLSTVTNGLQIQADEIIANPTTENPAGGTPTTAVSESHTTSTAEEWDSEERNEMSYKEKIKLVGDILQKEVSIIPKPGKNFSMVLEEDGGEEVGLPPSQGFPRAFEKWHNELRGAEGSIRGRQRPGEVCEMYHFPPKPKSGMGAYTIVDRPWQQTAPPANKNLLESSLYRGKEEPFVRVHPAKLKSIETSMRECISILSHMDWFLAASKVELGRQTEELSTREIVNTEELGVELEDWTSIERRGILAWAEQVKDKSFNADQTTWNSLNSVIALIESAGRCAQDAAKLVIDAVGCTTLVRRDAWLDKFPELLPKETLLGLRGGDVNGEKLFDESMLKTAMEQVEVKKSAQVQERFLANDKRPQKYEPKNFSKNSNFEKKNRGFQRPFRGQGDKGAGAPTPSNPKQGGQKKRRFTKK